MSYSTSRPPLSSTASPSTLDSSSWLPSSSAHALITDHRGPVTALRFNSTGEYLFTASYDRNIYLYNTQQLNPSSSSSSSLPSPLLLSTYPVVHGYSILSLSLSPSSSHLLSAGGDRTLYLWDVSTGAVIRRFHGHEQRVNAVEWAGEGGSVCVSGSYDRTVRVWDVRVPGGGGTAGTTTHSIQILSHALDSISCVSFSPSSFSLISSSIDGCLRTYDLRSSLLRTDSFGKETSLTSFCWLPEQAAGGGGEGGVVVSCLDSSARLVELETGKQLGWFGGEHVAEEYTIECGVMLGETEKEGAVVCASEDGTVVAYDLLNGKRMKKWNHAQVSARATGVSSSTAFPSSSSSVSSSPSNRVYVSSLECNPSGGFASGCADGSVILWR